MVENKKIVASGVILGKDKPELVSIWIDLRCKKINNGILSNHI